MVSTHCKPTRNYSLILAVLTMVSLAVSSADAQTLTTLYNFGGAAGANPYAGLISDPAGNLYGTTQYGGDSDNGAVWMLTKNGNSYTQSTLYSFSKTNDGGNPTGGLVRDAAGILYGTTSSAGAFNRGTVFMLDPSTHVLTTLSSFGGDTDGWVPYAGVIMDSAGNLYGTTSTAPGANGSVFMLNPGTQVLTTLYTFTDPGTGAFPNYGNLLMDADGNLYGATLQGGSFVNCQFGCGVVYKLTKNGDGYTQSVLYTFSGQSDGSGPQSGLAMDASGNLYGTTALGGTSNYGTVFKLTKNGDTYSQSVLYSFNGTNGGWPYAGVTLDAAGNVYGTTGIGGTNGFGTVFMLAKNSGNYNVSVLHSFSRPDGTSPRAGLLLDNAGNFYGTGYNGGTANRGTVFVLAMPAITSPARNSTLTSSTVNFTWTAKNGATSYQLWLGSSPNTHDVGVIGTSNVSGALANVPTDGRQLYATLYAYANNTWSVLDTATYTAASFTNAQITSPAKGSTLTSSVVWFTWSPESGATSYQLWAGSTPGSFDITYGGTSDTTVALALPTDGRTVYVTLWGFSGGSWSLQDTATYTAATQ